MLLTPLFLCAILPHPVRSFSGKEDRMKRDSDSDSDSDSSFILSGNPSTPLFSLLLGENSPASATTTVCHHLPQTPFLSTRTPFTQLSPEPADFLSTDSPIKRLRSDCAPPTIPQSSKLARQRRQTMSAKTRALQKLMPGDARMDTATTLEEARKYVQFLQAQIRVLQSMPCVDHQMVSSSRHGTFNNPDDPNLINSKLNIDKSAFGDHQLGMLNRQQLVEVMLNSAVGQTWLSSQGCCVFSLEQVAALKKQWGGKLL